MTSTVNRVEFLRHVPIENRDLHRTLLDQITLLERVHAEPSARKSHCYDVYIDGLDGDGSRREHILRVHGGKYWKDRDLKPVWLASKLGDARLAKAYAKRWASYVKGPDNPDSSEVTGGLQKIGVSNVIQILRESAEDASKLRHR